MNLTCEGGVDMSGSGTRGWLIDLVGGGVTGGLAGAVVAVNVVIYSGIEEGYEASLIEVFEQNFAVGIVTVAILLAGPILGVVTARRLRRKRTQTGQEGAKVVEQVGGNSLRRSGGTPLPLGGKGGGPVSDSKRDPLLEHAREEAEGTELLEPPEQGAFLEQEREEAQGVEVFEDPDATLPATVLTEGAPGEDSQQCRPWG